MDVTSAVLETINSDYVKPDYFRDGGATQKGASNAALLQRASFTSSNAGSFRLAQGSCGTYLIGEPTHKAISSFCTPVLDESPDIIVVVRRMSKDEIALCSQNDVNRIVEANFGAKDDADLFVYFNAPTARRMLEVQTIAAELTSDKASGKDGYLTELGVIPISDAARMESQTKVDQMLEMKIEKEV